MHLKTTCKPSRGWRIAVLSSQAASPWPHELIKHQWTVTFLCHVAQHPWLQPPVTLPAGLALQSSLACIAHSKWPHLRRSLPWRNPYPGDSQLRPKWWSHTAALQTHCPCLPSSSHPWTQEAPPQPPLATKLHDWASHRGHSWHLRGNPWLLKTLEQGSA